MLHTKFQGFLKKSASLLFIFWIYVLSPLMTISVIGGYGVKADSKINICHSNGNGTYNAQSVNGSALSGHIPGHAGDFLYTGPVNASNPHQGEPDSTGNTFCANNVPVSNHAPVLASHSNITEHTTSASGKTVTYTNPTATDPDSGDSATVVCLPASGSNFTVGTTTVTCTATDSHAATDVKTFTVTIIQDAVIQTNTPPTILPHDDVTVHTSNALGETVAYTNPSATDTDLGDSATVACLPASGSTFTVGTTIVTCTATDTHDATDSTTFNVNVILDPVILPNNPPSISGHNDVTVHTTDGTGTIVDFTSPNATDPDSGDSAAVSCLPTSGSTFVIGTTIVNCTATDTHDATDSTSFSVNVILDPPADTQAPVISFTGFKDQTSASYDNAPTTKSCGSFNVSGYISWEWALENDESSPVTYTYKILSGPTAVGYTATTTSTHYNGGIPAEGTYEVEVYGTDEALNKGEAVQCSVTFDKTAPAAPENLHFNNPALSCGAMTTVNSNTVDWNDVVGAAKYEYNVDYPLPSGGRGNWTTFPTASQYTGSLNQGTHHIRVRAIDGAGNTSDWSSLCDITLDSVAPAAPTGLHWDNIARTIAYSCGDSAQKAAYIPDWDDVTGDTTFSHYEYTSFWPDGSIGLNEQILNTSEFVNNWVAPIDGNFGYAVRSVDTAGNKSAWALTGKTLEGSCKLNMDSTAPVITINNPDTSFAKLKSISASTSEGVLTQVINAIGNTTCNDSLSFSAYSDATFTSESDNGKYVCYRAQDGVGNTSYLLSAQITGIDRTAPTVHVVIPVSNASFKATVPVEISADDSYSGIAPNSVKFHLYRINNDLSEVLLCTSIPTVFDGTVWKAAINDGVTCNLTEGKYKIKAWAYDNAGNPGWAAHRVFVIDTTAPFLTLPADIEEEATSASGNHVNFVSSATDETSGALLVTCSPTSGSLFPIGTTVVHCSTSDEAGNSAEGQFSVTVQDTTKPDVTVPSNITKEANGPSGRVVNYSGQSANDNIDGVIPATCSPLSGSTFPLGVNTVTCSATDAHGNTGTNSFTVTVRDTTRPIFGFIKFLHIIEATTPEGAPYTFHYTANDIVDGTIDVICTPESGSVFPLFQTTKVTCSAIDHAGNRATKDFYVLVLDTTKPVFGETPDIKVEATEPGGAHVPFNVTATDLVDTNVNITCLPSSNSLFHIGTRTVHCFAVDNYLNIATRDFKVTVVDETAPTLKLPDDQTIQATGPEGAVATFAATATDIVDGDVTPVCLPVSGSTFALGMNTVTCTAVDAHGNSSLGQFTVTVIDTLAPIVTVPENIVLHIANDFGTVSNFESTASDLVDGAMVPTCVQPSGSNFTLGLHTITCSATDLHGNTGSASFTIEVLDEVAPTVDLVFPAIGPSGTTFEAHFSENVKEVEATDPANYFLNNWPTAGGSGPLEGDATIVYDSETHIAIVTFTNPGWYVSPEQQWGVQNIHDTAGNVIAVTPYTEYSTPMVAPITSDNGTDANWHSSDVTVNFVCSDVNGSGCYQTFYKINGGSEVQGNSVTFSTDGEYSILYHSVDNAGNIETEHPTSYAVKIDKTLPFITLPNDQSFNEDSTGFYHYAFTPIAHESEFETTIVEGNSNDLAITCIPSQLGFDYPVGTTPVNCSATDRAGNLRTSTFNVTVSNLVPTVSISAVQNGDNSYTFTANPLGGNAPYTYVWSNECTGTGVTAETGSTPATYDCTVTVTDADGDTASESISRTVTAPANVQRFQTAAVQGVKTESTPSVTPTPSPEVLGERTCTTTSKFVGYTYIDKNKNNSYDSGEELVAGLTGKLTYENGGLEYMVKTFTSDQNGKFEASVCAGEYTVSIDKSALPSGMTDTATHHTINVLGEKAETVAYIALLSATKTNWSWWWALLALVIIGVIYFIYRRRQLVLETSTK